MAKNKIKIENIWAALKHDHIIAYIFEQEGEHVLKVQYKEHF